MDIRTHDGKLLEPNVNSIGPPVPAWQLQLATPVGSSNGTVPLAELQTLLQGIDLLRDAPVAELLAADFLSAATSPVNDLPPHLLLSLGPGGSDARFYTSGDSSDVALAPVQTWVVLRRLAAEAIDALPTPQGFEVPGTSASNAVRQPCTFSPEQEFIVGAGEKFERKLFKQFISYIEKNIDSGRNTATELLKVAKALTGVADAFLLYSSLAGSVSMEHEPLQRTRARHPQTGERVAVGLTLRYDVPHGAEGVNCLRLAMASIGIKAPKIPPSGPIQGALVQWRGIQGFTLDAGLDGAYLQFKGRPDKGVTDQEGKAFISVEGTGQRRDVPDNSQAVEKYGKVAAVVAPVGPHLWRDLLDAASQGASLDPIRIGLSILKRTRWWSLPISFTVRDWGDRLDTTSWTGTVSFNGRKEHKSAPTDRKQSRLVVEASSTTHFKVFSVCPGKCPPPLVSGGGTIRTQEDSSWTEGNPQVACSSKGGDSFTFKTVAKISMGNTGAKVVSLGPGEKFSYTVRIQCPGHKPTYEATVWNLASSDCEAPIVGEGKSQSVTFDCRFDDSTPGRAGTVTETIQGVLTRTD